MKKHHFRNWEKPRHMGPPGFRRKRRSLLGAFIAFLFFLVLPLVLLGGAFGFSIAGVNNAPPRLGLAVATICGFPLLLAMIIGSIGAVAFRRMGTPLANIMAATDAVANGNLSTRVPETGQGNFRRMAKSFNRMASELERADQQRRNLTADVAHELRTPLHILQGNLEGLQDGIYQPTPAHIEAMLDETQMLTRLVDDLQTLSLAEAGQLLLRFEPVNLTELLADVRTSFSGPMHSAGIDLKVEMEGAPANLIISGDVERLDQVLSNLLGNALRHTPKGGSILLRATATPKGVQILVRDTGEGIPPKDIPYIFDRFWRGDKSRQRQNRAGSGLGLAIANQFVQAHEGKLSVESQLGNGTTFIIDIPKDQRA